MKALVERFNSVVTKQSESCAIHMANCHRNGSWNGATEFSRSWMGTKAWRIHQGSFKFRPSDAATNRIPSNFLLGIHLGVWNWHIRHVVSFWIVSSIIRAQGNNMMNLSQSHGHSKIIDPSNETFRISSDVDTAFKMTFACLLCP